MYFFASFIIYFYGDIMYIKTLLKKANLSNEFIVVNHYVKGIKSDSRIVEENDVFFAIKGGQTDGKKYIEEAITKGAKTIVYEGKLKKEHHNINYYEVTNIKRILALFCKVYYKDLTKKRLQNNFAVFFTLLFAVFSHKCLHVVKTFYDFIILLLHSHKRSCLNYVI